MMLPFIEIQKELNRRESKMAEIISATGYVPPEPPPPKTMRDLLREGTAWFGEFKWVHSDDIREDWE